MNVEEIGKCINNLEYSYSIGCRNWSMEKAINVLKRIEEEIIKNKKSKMKIPYQIRIEPEQLEALKKLAKENGTSVNHEIRQSIRKVLTK